MRDTSLTEIDVFEDLDGVVSVLADTGEDEGVFLVVESGDHEATAALSPKYARYLSRALRLAEKTTRGEV